MTIVSDNLFPPLSQEEFNEYIAPLGPWGEDTEDSPPIAVAVSGGADSLCLAVMVSQWRKNIIAFIVDHKLRKTSTMEAVLTQNRLSSLSIPSKILTVNHLEFGSALEERARIARYDLLFQSCYEMGCIDLLLGHHAGDQAETVLMRIRAGSGEDGISAMARIMELPRIRLIRPLLSVPPQRLKATLREKEIQWVEDESNQDMQIQRNRLRRELSLGWNKTGTIQVLLKRSLEEGVKRMEKDQIQANYCAQNIELRPEGFALLPKNGLDERVLAALIRTISGSIYAPLQKSIQKLARNMQALTLGGVQIVSAGRLGEGWLMIREQASIAKPVLVGVDTIWDQRFRVRIPDHQFKAQIPNVMIGALGEGYKQFSSRQGLPVSVLKTLPGLWIDNELIAVPHLNICLNDVVKDWKIIFQPKQPVTQSYLFAVK